MNQRVAQIEHELEASSEIVSILRVWYAAQGRIG
jgi:hypothetical protein